MLASLVVLLVGMFGVGWWIGQQIETGVVDRTSATTALYVDSFLTPDLQSLATSPTLTPDHAANISRLLKDTSLGKQVVIYKIWDAQGRILYSSDQRYVDRVFPIDANLAHAWQGTVEAEDKSSGRAREYL